jgi:3-phenylpropionate/trans-cinnamate dioxygenase ferredoxin subunit
MSERPISVDNGHHPLAGDAGWLPVCGLSRLMSQTVVAVRVAGIDLVLVWSDGRVVACERACPHEQADLACGHVAGGRLCCPRHAASFDLKDGRISYGWPSRPLRLYPVRVDSGQILIASEALR